MDVNTDVTEEEYDIKAIFFFLFFFFLKKKNL